MDFHHLFYIVGYCLFDLGWPDICWPHNIYIYEFIYGQVKHRMLHFPAPTG
jgi:hypothetical protein